MISKVLKKENVTNILIPLMTLIILSFFLSVMTDEFLKIKNLLNVLRQASLNVLVSFGMFFVLLTGGIDLSVGAVIACSGCVMGLMIQAGISNSLVLIGAGLSCGMLIGVANGLLFTKLGLPHPFVSTLGMQLFIRGLCSWMTGSASMTGFPAGVLFLGSAQIAGFPVCFLLVLIVGFVAALFLNQTAFGSYLYSIGGNREAAKLSGIKVKELTTITYVLSGLFAALAGIVMIGRVGLIYPTAGEGYEMNAIAACIIGGTSFNGGRGSIAGTLIGTLFIAILNNGLTLMNVNSAIRTMLLGLIIIFAVFLDEFRVKREERFRKLRTTKH